MEDQSQSINLSVEETEPGCCHQLLQSFANIIHLADLIGGLFFLGYGIAIAIHGGPDPQHAIATFLMIWASLLLLASSSGIIGFTTPVCRRYGILMSAYLGPVIAVWNCGVVFYLLVEKRHFFIYLLSKANQLLLSSGDIENLEKNFVLWIIVIAVFAVGEVGRFYILKHLREDLLMYDIAKHNERQHNNRRLRDQEQREWENNPLENNSIRTPLLSNEHMFSQDAVNLEQKNDSNIFQQTVSDKSWWEEPEEVWKPEEEDKSSSWLFGVWSKSKDAKSATQSSHVRDIEVARGGRRVVEEEDEESVDEFAPVDEDLNTSLMGSPDHTKWSEHQSEKGKQDDQDLSWVTENQDNC